MASEWKSLFLTVDHILPASRGGALSWMNTVAACQSCNALKADRTPEEARMPLLFTPYLPRLPAQGQAHPGGRA